ncbi:hypothetical protein ONZ45_g14236 [Pleurotus djamor]|nr:hypothetical protein ONZ45_g14236 [Pleurotus djamor]
MRSINITAKQVTDPFQLHQWPNSRITELITVHQPRKPEEVLEEFPFLRPSRHSGQGDLGLLSRLPVELLAIILKEHLATESLIMLCITNSQLFRLGYPLLGKHILDFVSPWSNGRFICLGSTGRVDLPEGCIPELNSFGDAEMSSPDQLQGLRFYKIAEETFGRVKAKFLPSSSASSRMVLDPAHGDDLRRLLLLSYDYRHLLKPVAQPVLVNLTKKQYVPSPGKTLKSLVVWGRESSSEHYGPWAGDELVILGMQDFKSRLEEESGQWADFTEDGDRLQYFIERQFY